MAREPEPLQRRQLRRAVRCSAACWRGSGSSGYSSRTRAGEAEVGDDERVEAGEVRRLQRRERRLHLVVLEQRVQRQVRARVVEMGRLDRLGDRLTAEVAGEGARAPAREPKYTASAPAERAARRARGSPPAREARVLS